MNVELWNEPSLLSCCCGAVAVELWFWSCGCGAVAVELWMHSGDCVVTKLWQCSCGCEDEVLELCLRTCDFAAVFVKLYLWSCDHGAVVPELWLWSCGAVAVACGAVSMVVTVEMWLVELWQRSSGCEAVVLWLPSYTNGAVIVEMWQ